MSIFGNTRYNIYYKTWANMKQRCCNPNRHDYKDYGGRGIKIYQGWIDDWRSFACYVIDTLGERPDGMTIDRTDNDGDYVPGNLRWETKSGQSQNRRFDNLKRTGRIKVHPVGKTGFRWVTTKGNQFMGQFYTRGKKYHTKSFSTAEEAYQAVIQLRIKVGVEVPSN